MLLKTGLTLRKGKFAIVIRPTRLIQNEKKNKNKNKNKTEQKQKKQKTKSTWNKKQQQHFLKKNLFDTFFTILSIL